MEKLEKIKNLKILITDVDGVLTDAGMYYTESGDEFKKFNTRDGMGIELWRNSGGKTVFVSGENLKLIKKRAEKLKIDYVFLGAKNKLKIIEELFEKERLRLSEAAFIGDDINDLSLLKKVGLSVCVADAVDEVKENVDIILTAKGGEGAVRELIDLLLRYKK